MSKLLVTRSSGLIGSEVIAFFCQTEFKHHEMDICDRAGVARLTADLKPDAIIELAPQLTEASRK